MLKRLPIILSILVFVSLSYPQFLQIANAQDTGKYTFPRGTSLLECKVVSLDPPLAIGFERDPNDTCKVKEGTMNLYGDLYCKGLPKFKNIQAEPGSKELIRISFIGSGNQFSKFAVSASGNQSCIEALFVSYKSGNKDNPCYEYPIGGRIFYLPPG